MIDTDFLPQTQCGMKYRFADAGSVSADGRLPRFNRPRIKYGAEVLFTDGARS